MTTQRKTPIGMVCKQCGEDKEPYNFFVYSGKYDRSFFVNGWQPGVCWQCAAPYRCILCKEVKDATHYRVGGRICFECQAAPKMARNDLKPLQERAGGVEDLSFDVEAADSLDTGGWE